MMSAQFVANGLKRHNEVERATPIDDQIVEVWRKKYPHFVVGVVSATRVEQTTIEDLAADYRVDFVCNIPREAVWTGAAIDHIQQHGKAFGGVADLFSASARSGPVRGFVRKEFEFAERIFDQHSAVARVERLYDRVYRLYRRSLPPVDVALINEYDLTADHIRTAWTRYGPFTDVLANNPNCRFTAEATAAANQLGVKLLMLGQFMGRLNGR